MGFVLHSFIVYLWGICIQLSSLLLIFLIRQELGWVSCLLVVLHKQIGQELLAKGLFGPVPLFGLSTNWIDLKSIKSMVGPVTQVNRMIGQITNQRVLRFSSPFWIVYQLDQSQTERVNSTTFFSFWQARISLGPVSTPMMSLFGKMAY